MQSHPACYLLDTCVLRQFNLREPHPSFNTWIQQIPAGSLAISFSTVIEIQRGIEKLKATNAPRAARLDEWLTTFLQTDVRFLAQDVATARLFGKMSSVPALKCLWVPDSRSKIPKLGQDIAIAATAIVHEIPIATGNVKDFLLIDQHFRLPGLFDPRTCHWEIPYRMLELSDNEHDSLDL